MWANKWTPVWAELDVNAHVTISHKTLTFLHWRMQREQNSASVSNVYAFCQHPVVIFPAAGPVLKLALLSHLIFQQLYVFLCNCAFLLEMLWFGNRTTQSASSHIYRRIIYPPVWGCHVLACFPLSISEKLAIPRRLSVHVNIRLLTNHFIRNGCASRSLVQLSNQPVFSQTEPKQVTFWWELDNLWLIGSK